MSIFCSKLPGNIVSPHLGYMNRNHGVLDFVREICRYCTDVGAMVSVIEFGKFPSK